MGGAVALDYRPARLALKVYVRTWRLLDWATGMAQGAAQFYGRDAFSPLGGFDERLFTGEDVDLFWRLKKLAKKTGGRAVFIRDIQVVELPRPPGNQLLSCGPKPYFTDEHSNRSLP
jgi:GT2 family glycosyltransferase